MSENFRTAPLLQVKLCQVGIIPGPAGQGLLFSWMNLISRLGWCDTGDQQAAGGGHTGELALYSSSDKVVDRPMRSR